MLCSCTLMLTCNTKIVLVDVLLHFRFHARNIRVPDLSLLVEILLSAVSLLLILIFDVDVGTILDISHALLSLSWIVLSAEHLVLFSVVELGCFNGVDVNHLSTIWVEVIAASSFGGWRRIKADSSSAIGKALVESELAHIFHSGGLEDFGAHSSLSDFIEMLVRSWILQEVLAVFIWIVVHLVDLVILRFTNVLLFQLLSQLVNPSRWDIWNQFPGLPSSWAISSLGVKFCAIKAIFSGLQFVLKLLQLFLKLWVVNLFFITNVGFIRWHLSLIGPAFSIMLHLEVAIVEQAKFLSILNCVNVFSVSAGLIVHSMDLIILLVIDVCNVFVLAFDSIDAGTVELIFVSVLVIAVLIIVLVLQLVVVATLTINIDELRILSFNQLRLQGVNDLLSVFNLH